MITYEENCARDRLTADEMRKLEADAMAAGRVEGGALMARAGARVIDAIAAAWPEAAADPGRAVILCGPGNNGGDGYVVARGLRARGWRVAVFALGDTEQLPPDARAAHDAWCADGGAVDPLRDAAARLEGADMVVDALFGIGLTRPLPVEVAEVLAAVPDSARRVAVDVPSGRETDTGAVLGGHAFDPDLTVTFHARKPVHDRLAEEGARVIVADIGL